MKKRLMKLLAGVAALGAFALGGSALAGAATSGSTGSTGATTSTGSTSQTGAPTGRAGFPAPGSAAHEDAEQAVTGTAATKARAAAVASVGSGTAGDVTTNYDKTGYEVTVTKADGTTVDVHLDLSFNVQTGPGRSATGLTGGRADVAAGDGRLRAAFLAARRRRQGASALDRCVRRRARP